MHVRSPAAVWRVMASRCQSLVNTFIKFLAGSISLCCVSMLFHHLPLEAMHTYIHIFIDFLLLEVEKLWCYVFPFLQMFLHCSDNNISTLPPAPFVIILGTLSFNIRIGESLLLLSTILLLCFIHFACGKGCGRCLIRKHVYIRSTEMWLQFCFKENCSVSAHRRRQGILPAGLPDFWRITEVWALIQSPGVCSFDRTDDKLLDYLNNDCVVFGFLCF